MVYKHIGYIILNIKKAHFGRDFIDSNTVTSTENPKGPANNMSGIKQVINKTKTFELSNFKLMKKIKKHIKISANSLIPY